MRSSPNGIAGDPGPEGRVSEAFRELAAEEEADRISKAGRTGEDGRPVLMRRKPLSRSAVRMGDLFVAGSMSAIVLCISDAWSHAMCCDVPTPKLFAACSPLRAAWRLHNACRDCLYAPGQVIVRTRVHAQPP